MTDWTEVLRDWRVGLGGLLLLVLMGVALAAPWLAPHDPNAQDLLWVLLPPSWAPGGDPAYLLGTDTLGRDVLSRLIWATRSAAYVAVLSTIGAAVLGITLALIAGYAGGVLDWIIMRAVELLLSFPAVVFALVLIAALGPGLENVIIAVIAVDWTRFARVLRSEVRQIKGRDYVAAARLMGATPLQVVLQDVLPNIMPSILMLVSLEMGGAVVAETIISFVSASAEADVPTWGVIIADGLSDIYATPAPVIAAVSSIVVFVLATILFSDGLRRRTDPRQIERRGAAA
ncbi:ABC transporter permease [Thalassovita mangrovi]|uniref:ABC transporter permease subunit n=1 Tax=Thalassovita mangrovi TaxID=2692236 RepID=A0A6L8LMT2_9RHOB|nr:ABC transporter permease [Thalassovita mangrovi]MYM56346.1 ABC transporter permease subunit [Thalassovita mangrovi]